MGISRTTRLALAITVFGLAGYLTIVYQDVEPHVEPSTPHLRSLLVDTPACRIPDLDPYDQSIMRFIRHYERVVCTGKPSITYGEGDILRINWTSVKEHYNDDIKYCQFQQVVRSIGDDRNISYGTPSSQITTDTKMTHEFIRVKCFDSSENHIYTNFHAFIIANESVKEQRSKNLQQHLEKNKPKEVMNVLMLGHDSVSRLNFLRQFPLTRRYLREELDAIELLGYNKIADNTLPNHIALLAGKFLRELPWTRADRNQTFDKYNFLWKHFANSGYMTMHSEDHPNLNMFNLRVGGFHKPQTDHYFRPLSLAMKGESTLWNGLNFCVGDRLEIDIINKYIHDFAIQYRERPRFVFSFLTRMTQRSANSAGRADLPFSNFLQKLNNDNILNNSFLLVYSDHGMRFGNFRNSHIGKFEERRPYIAFVFPKWFKMKYPQHIKNMVINARRLTTPFDVHETLKSMLYFTGQTEPADPDKRGISLFSEISPDRTCDDAGILPHWCTCLERENISRTTDLAEQVASVVVQALNEQLAPYLDICEKLELDRIDNIEKMRPRSEIIKYRIVTTAVSMFQITLFTKPSGALFEATVKYDEQKGLMTLAGDVSRINRYGDQSKCIDNEEMRKYCYCKIQ